MKEQKRKNDWYQWMNLVISEPYYVYHFIILFSYLIEIQAILALLMLVTIKLVKEESWEGFLSMFFSLLIDIQLALSYMVVFFGHATRLTPLQLEVILIEGKPLNSSNCIRTSRFISDLSITYSNKSLSFGIVDLGLFPNALIIGEF
ncbi:hypothetical protein MKW92_053005 [Papaver armeniacum]|nr:hypothetical protein MKW92_053005 [Papaver armeniacum]